MAEFELKFELAPAAHAAFRRLSALGGAAPRSARLHAMYFDTPDFALRKREMALRLRRTGKSWAQCLKAGRSGAGGWHAREEWEFARPEPSLDLALFSDTPLGREPALDERLVEIFRVDVRRTTWQVEPSPGNRLEVALDRGEVARLGDAEAVAEVEIECLEGDPLAAFELAERLIDAAPLRPSAVTKAQRGYRLARGEPLAPARARPASLEPAMAPPVAARAVAAAALEQLQANEPGVLGHDDPEYLHQFRVALRRLRSALRTFRTALEPQFLAQAGDELRWIAALTGPARDWDVLATQTLPAMLEAHGAARSAQSVRLRVAVRRDSARAQLREALGSPRYARLVLRLARWLATPAAALQPPAEPLADFALRIVAKRHKRLVADARKLSALTPAERHELRLDAKRLRYAVEGFAPLLRRGRVAAYLEALSEIQDDLGHANDAAVAARLLGEIALPAAFGHFARGWLAAHAHASASGIERHGARLAAARTLKVRGQV